MSGYLVQSRKHVTNAGGREFGKDVRISVQRKAEAALIAANAGIATSIDDDDAALALDATV